MTIAGLTHDENTDHQITPQLQLGRLQSTVVCSTLAYQSVHHLLFVEVIHEAGGRRQRRQQEDVRNELGPETTCVQSAESGYR